MIGILDRIARERGIFLARNLDDVFAIQLANSLSDFGNLRSYLKLVPEFSRPRVAAAFRRTLERSPAGTQTLEAFGEELAQRGEETPAPHRLIACKIGRRDVACVVFYGERIEYARCLQLSSKEEASRRSIANFIGGVLSDHPAAAFATSASGEQDTRQRRLQAFAIEQVHAAALPLWAVSSRDVCAAFSIPAFQSPDQIRPLLGVLHPALDQEQSRASTLDAAAIGILVQYRALLQQSAQ